MRLPPKNFFIYFYFCFPPKSFKGCCQFKTQPSWALYHVGPTHPGLSAVAFAVSGRSWGALGACCVFSYSWLATSAGLISLRKSHWRTVETSSFLPRGCLGEGTYQLRGIESQWAALLDQQAQEERAQILGWLDQRQRTKQPDCYSSLFQGEITF